MLAGVTEALVIVTPFEVRICHTLPGKESSHRCILYHSSTQIHTNIP